MTDLYTSNGLGDFTYVFSETSGDVLPGETKQVDLSVTVPIGKPQGQYTFDVNATWNTTLFGIITTSHENAYLDVILNVIPEFTTIAIPSAIALGIMFLVFRRNRKD